MISQRDREYYKISCPPHANKLKDNVAPMFILRILDKMMNVFTRMRVSWCKGKTKK